MKNKISRAVVLMMMGIFTVAIAAHHEKGVVHPAKISKSDAAGQIFDREDMLKTTHDDGHTTLDVTTLLSSDGTVTRINAGEGVTIPMATRKSGLSIPRTVQDCNQYRTAARHFLLAFGSGPRSGRQWADYSRS